MTDLMCHPEHFDKWSKSLGQDINPCPVQGRCPSDPSAAAPSAPEPASPSRAADAAKGEPLDAVVSKDASGHSGVMRLAAGIIKHLAEQRILFDLLQSEDDDDDSGCAFHSLSMVSMLCRMLTFTTGAAQLHTRTHTHTHTYTHTQTQTHTHTHTHTHT